MHWTLLQIQKKKKKKKAANELKIENSIIIYFSVIPNLYSIPFFYRT